MIVEVMLVICLNTAARLGCTNIPITSNKEVQDNGAVVNMSGCMTLEGAVTAQKYWEEHQKDYPNYEYGGWACRIGNKELPERGKAQSDPLFGPVPLAAAVL